MGDCDEDQLFFRDDCGDIFLLKAELDQHFATSEKHSSSKPTEQELQVYQVTISTFY